MAIGQERREVLGSSFPEQHLAGAVDAELQPVVRMHPGRYQVVVVTDCPGILAPEYRAKRPARGGVEACRHLLPLSASTNSRPSALKPRYVLVPGCTT